METALMTGNPPNWADYVAPYPKRSEKTERKTVPQGTKVLGVLKIAPCKFGQKVTDDPMNWD